MTIASTDSKISYAGNGSTTVFAVPFYFLANGDLRVVLVDALGAETEQTYTTHYTLTGAGDPNGGSLTMVTAPASGKTLVILREPEIVQETQYVENDDFPASAHEKALDLLTMICQSLKEQIDRSVKVGITGGNPSTLIDEINQAVIDSEASAIAAETAQGLAEDARDSAIAAAASVPADALRTANNLSDLESAAAARTNLGVKAPSEVTAYTKQQYATPATVTPSSGAVTLDAELHQDCEITSTQNLTMNAPTNAVKGMQMFIRLYAASALTITWNAVFKANADVALPTAHVAGKATYCNFRFNGTNWVLLGTVTEA